MLAVIGQQLEMTYKSPGLKSLQTHTTIVLEMQRLLSLDSNNNLSKAIEQSPQLAMVFQLDILIKAEDFNLKRIGIAMGALLMTRVTNLDLSHVVHEDYCMEKIS
jgi:hypothetical protein